MIEIVNGEALKARTVRDYRDQQIIGALLSQVGSLVIAGEQHALDKDWLMLEIDLRQMGSLLASAATLLADLKKRSGEPIAQCPPLTPDEERLAWNPHSWREFAESML